MDGAPAGARNGDAGVDPTPGVVLPAVLAPKVNEVPGADDDAGAGDPNRNPPVAPPLFVLALALAAAGAAEPNVNVDGEADAPAPGAGVLALGVPNVKLIPPAGLAAAGVDVGVAEPNVKPGVELPAGAVFCGESSIISPPPPFPAGATAAGLAPNPPNPPVLEVAPNPFPEPLDDEGAPKENPLLAGLLLSAVAELLLLVAGAPNTNAAVGVMVPDAGADVAGEEAATAGASEEALLGAPNENVGAAAAGLASGTGLLPALLLALEAPKLNPPVVAGFEASAAAGLGAPKLNPPDEVVSAGLDVPNPVLLALLSEDDGLPNVNPPLEAGAAGLEASSPLLPKKFGTLLDFADVASSFFSAAAAAGAPKLNPEEAGAAGVEAAGAPNEKLSVLFLAAGSASSSALRLDPEAAVEVDGAPKLNPPVPEEAVDEPKNEGLLAGAADSCFFSADSAGFAPNDPKGLLAGVDEGVLVDPAAAGLAAPKLKGAGLLAAASPAAAGAPNENPPEAAGAAGTSVDLLSNFFMVLPKKLGTGPSFLFSLREIEAGSAGLLKKSEVGAAGFFAVLSPSFDAVLGAALAPKLNLGMVLGASLEGAEKEKDGDAAVVLGASFLSVCPVGADESKSPRRPSNEPPAFEAAELVALEADSEAASAVLAVAVAKAGAGAELPNEKPDGNMLVGSLIFASSLASGKSSSSSSSSQALNLPEL